MRFCERVGSPKDFVKHFEEFYDLDADWISHLLAFEFLREAEQAALSGAT